MWRRPYFCATLHRVRTRPTEPGPRKLKHSSIRLNNNAIVELQGEGANVVDEQGVDLGPPPSLEMALSHVVADLSMIRWIDLSFNNIRVFGDCFKCLPALQVLNLQANRISDLKQVKKLGELPKLKKLSLFGNPIEEKKHYRSYVITVCPLVGQLDSPSSIRSATRRRVGRSRSEGS